MITSDSQLETVKPVPTGEGQKDDLAVNSHPADGVEGGAPVLDGELHHTERPNVNAMREAIETQAEMEVGKPIEEKQEEVKEEVAAEDAAVSVKKTDGGTQIIINIAGRKKEMSFSNLVSAQDFIKGASAKFGKKFAVLSRPDQCPKCGSLENTAYYRGEEVIKDGKKYNKLIRYNPFDKGSKLWDVFKCNDCGHVWPFTFIQLPPEQKQSADQPVTSGMSDIDGGAPTFKGAASKEELEELGKDIAEQGNLEEFHQKKTKNPTMQEYHKRRRLELQKKYNELRGKSAAKVYVSDNPEEPGIDESFYDGYFKQNYPALWDAWQTAGTHNISELRQIVKDQGLSINPEMADKVRAAKYILDWHKGQVGGRMAPKQGSEISELSGGRYAQPREYVISVGSHWVGKDLNGNFILTPSPKAAKRYDSMDDGREVKADAANIKNGIAKGLPVRITPTAELPYLIKEGSMKSAAINFSPSRVPSQVVEEFYPELQHELISYPNVTNSPMQNPEISGDTHELGTGPAEGIGEATLVMNDEELLPAAIEDAFEGMNRIGYVSTSPAGAAGIGRDGKTVPLEGAELMKPDDIRTPGFMEEFYAQYDGGIPGSSLTVISAKVAAAEEKQQFSLFLKKVMGEVAASFIAAFKVTSKMPMNKVPGVGEIQLAQVEQATNTSAFNLVNTGSRVKYLMDKLTDSEIQDAINDAYAQGAVWHEAKEGGFVYEVFVRAETIDTESMILKYKFVTGTKEAE